MKTNFEKITRSPEALAEFILKQYGFSQVKEDNMYFNLLQWFGWTDNEDTETEEDQCETCKYFYNNVCQLESQGCQTEMYERFEPIEK